MIDEPMTAAIEAFRKWDGFEDDEHPGDELRVPLEEAIGAYLDAERKNR